MSTTVSTADRVDLGDCLPFATRVAAHMSSLTSSPWSALRAMRDPQGHYDDRRENVYLVGECEGERAGVRFGYKDGRLHLSGVLIVEHPERRQEISVSRDELDAGKLPYIDYPARTVYQPIYGHARITCSIEKPSVQVAKDAVRRLLPLIAEDIWKTRQERDRHLREVQERAEYKARLDEQQAALIAFLDATLWDRKAWSEINSEVRWTYRGASAPERAAIKAREDAARQHPGQYEIHNSDAESGQRTLDYQFGSGWRYQLSIKFDDRGVLEIDGLKELPQALVRSVIVQVRDFVKNSVPCDTCQGTGESDSYRPCSACEGLGIVSPTGS